MQISNADCRCRLFGFLEIELKLLADRQFDHHHRTERIWTNLNERSDNFIISPCYPLSHPVSANGGHLNHPSTSVHNLLNIWRLESFKAKSLRSRLLSPSSSPNVRENKFSFSKTNSLSRKMLLFISKFSKRIRSLSVDEKSESVLNFFIPLIGYRPFASCLPTVCRWFADGLPTVCRLFSAPFNRSANLKW